MTQEELSKISDEIVRDAHKKYPMELQELGALFISIGCFLVCNAVPDLWVSLRPAAELSHQLLNQEENKRKAKTLTNTPL